MNSAFILPSLIAAVILPGTAAAAITLTNGNFENTSGTFPAGWNATGTVSSVAPITAGGASSAQLDTGETINQDFAATPADALFNFQLDFAFRTSVAPGSDVNQNRVRIRGNANAADIITMAFDNNSIRTFSGSFADDFVTGVSLAANTTYFFRLTGSNLDTAGRSFVLGFSTDGINFTSSAAPSTRFHSAVVGTGFETIAFDGNGATLTLDNVTVVAIPEPAVSAMFGLALLGLVRRRR